MQEQHYHQILASFGFDSILKFNDDKLNIFLAYYNQDGKFYFCKFHFKRQQYQHELKFLNLVADTYFNVYLAYYCNYHLLLCTNFESLESLESYWIKYKTELRQKFTEISTALIDSIEQLRTKNICHFDLNLSNIVGYNLMIAGFSGVQWNQIQRSNKYKSEKLEFIAPQRLANYEYKGQSVELYSLGVMLFMLYFGKYPFENLTQTNKETRWKSIQSQRYWNKLPQISQQLKQIFKKMLSVDLSERPSLLQLKKIKQLYRKDDRNNLANYLKQLSDKQYTQQIKQHNQNKIIKKYEKIKNYEKTKFISKKRSQLNRKTSLTNQKSQKQQILPRRSPRFEQLNQ